MTIFKKSAGLATGFAAALLSSSPLWGDDTEIFFGTQAADGSAPNVLFIIDTSGSMSSNVPGTGMDRLDNVKAAFRDLIDELENVNVGLMRFTNPGGPVLAPVRNLNSDLQEGRIVTLNTPITASTDDARAIESTGQVFTTEPGMPLVISVSGGTETFQDQVARDEDDGEAFTDDADDPFDNNDLDIVGRDYDIWSGIRFSGVDIPADANVSNAFIRLTASSTGRAGDVLACVRGDRFENNEGIFDEDTLIPTRGNTVDTVQWLIERDLDVDETIDTPNLAGIINEQVRFGGYNGPDGEEDDLVFVIGPCPGVDYTGQGLREFWSYNGSPSRSARLFVEYSEGALVEEPSQAGLRFDNVDLPRGVTVTDAYIEFTAAQDHVGNYDYTYEIQDDANPVTFAPSASNIASRPWIGSVSDSGTHDLSTGDIYRSASITDLVQGMSDRSSFCGGNAMAFRVTGTQGTLPVVFFDGDPSLAPRLVIRYEADSIPEGTSCFRARLTRTLTSSADDAEENGSSATSTSGDLDFVRNNDVGLRFPDIQIPQNAAIHEAFIRLTADAEDNGSTRIDVFSEISDNPKAYSSTDGTIQDRSYTGPVAWNISDRWRVNDVNDTPDLSAMIRARVQSGGWEPGNALAFKLVTSNNNDREAESVEGSPAEAPTLVIEYTDDGTGQTGTTWREELRTVVDQLNHQGWTPVQDTLYEAALYYTGSDAKWGLSRGVSGIDGGPFNYARVSSLDSLVEGTGTLSRPAGCTDENLDSSACRNERILGVGGTPRYESPINDFCQAQNHVILLTDGDANRPHSRTDIEGFIGESCETFTVDEGGSVRTETAGERCVQQLSRYMLENDAMPELNGKQSVITHTIGFNFSSAWLEDVANAGGGISTTADNAVELTSEIKEIIAEALKNNSTFVAPVAAVNEFNQLSHLSQVYFAVFRPDEKPFWRGNLKKYTLAPGSGVILDSLDNPAIDEATGFFTDSSRSFWSDSADGPFVDVGGAAQELPSNVDRKLYTWLPAAGSNTLTVSGNLVSPSNTLLTDAVLDTPPGADIAEHINWIRGADVDDENINGNTLENRYYLGDPLHSRPVAVTYGDPAEDPDVTVYFGANDGAIHAINAETGVEQFAFMPEELLPISNQLRSNLATTSHPYGMDLTMTVWRQDTGRDGIDPAVGSGDFVRLYAGMRRGGRSYYALDVTSRDNPALMWQIRGGEIQDNGDDFTELGQTWSRPIRTKLLLDGDTSPTDVLLFSGGYDEAQDEATTRRPDDMGRAMYIVNAETGALIWSGGTDDRVFDKTWSDMEYSFPSTMSAIDINQDGLLDSWYAADTGGQLWRFDVTKGAPVASMVNGGVVADLGSGAEASPDVLTNRRFFASPSVALVRGPEGAELAIAIGSGFRASPLSYLASNRMFVIRQKDVFSPPTTYKKLKASDLFDATSNVLSDKTDSGYVEAKAELADSSGWYFDLPNEGEKVLSSPLIANGNVVFTTYTPGNSANWCRPAAGTSRAYSVGLEDAVRMPPIDLKTPSIVDQAAILLPPTKEPSVEPTDPNEPEVPPEPSDPSCPSGSRVVIKLNAEDGPVDTWCNDASLTYWVRDL